MEKFVVRLDPDLKDLIPGFLANKGKDVQTILSATATKPIDFDALGRLGHRLKGEGGSYGLEAISVYGDRIERAAKRGDVDAIQRYANQLSVYLDSLEIVYEQE